MKHFDIWPDDTAFDALGASLFTWWWLAAFLGYGKQWLSFRNRALDYLGEASYPLYILHQSVMVVLAYWIVQQSWAWGVKYLVLLMGTLVLSLLLYETLVRRLPPLRLLFGLKNR